MRPNSLDRSTSTKPSNLELFRKVFRASLSFIVAVAIVQSITVARAQSFATAVPVGASPAAVAVNPVTNKVYVADSGGTSVTVINAATDTVTATVPVGTNPVAIAINPVTNTIYVASGGSSASVTVINGATDTVAATVTVGTNPTSIAVNPVTNTVFVASSGAGSNNVTVINGSSNQVAATVSVGGNPVAVALNPATNMIYVANKTDGTVTVINGSLNQATATIGVGTNPVSIAVNPATNTIYVANNGSNNVSVFAGGASTSVPVADPNATGPIAVAVNPVTNTIYVANHGSNNVTTIAGATNATKTLTDPNASGPAAVAVNSLTNRVYVANNGSNNVTSIAGTTNATTTIKDPNATLPAAIAVNPVTNQIYAANSGSSTVSVINGSTNGTVTVKDSNANHPAAVGVNPVTNVIYVANANSNNVSVILGANGTTQTVTDTNANHPVALAVNPFTNKIYVANANSNNVTVVDGTNNSTVTVTDPNAGSPIAVAVNPVTNKIYVVNFVSNNITVIDGATNHVSTMSDPSALGPVAIALDPATGKLYVANSGSNNVSVFDSLDSTVLTISDPAAGQPIAIAVNPVTNEVYVANSASDNLTVISGATNSVVATIDTDISPIAVGVNAATNMIYVANSGTDNVTVINGATLTVVSAVPAGTSPHAIAVNLTTNQIYVANNGNGGSDPGSITAIDGASNSTTTLTDPNAIGPYALAANIVTNQLYVANNLSANVTSLTPESVQANAISSTITPLTGNPNNETSNETPAFTFGASNGFPGGAIDDLVFQVDSWAGPWAAAMTTPSTPGVFTGTTATLAPGFHTIYVYASDGEEGTSTITGAQSSPLIGTIAAYGFLVAPPVADPSPTNLTFASQQTGSPSSAQLVKLGNTGGTTLTFSYAFTGLNSGDFSEGVGDTCSASGGQLAPNASCTVSVIFTPSTNSGETAALTFTDNSNGVAGSTQNVSLAGTGSAVPTLTLSVGEAGSGLGTVTSSPSGISCQPNCSANFNQGTIVTLTASPLAGSTFIGWAGGCTGTGTCIVTMNATKTVTANFSLTAATACSAANAAIWTGATSTNWGTASNWSTGVVPNGSTASVCINNGHTPAAQVNLNIGVTVGNLVIDSGSSLTIGNNLDFQVTESIFNAGQIIVNAAANGTALSMTGAVTLTGGGTVTLTNGNALIRQDGTGSLTNVNNTIAGAGQIGNNGLTFTNQAAGIVNANSGGALQVNASGAVNQGTFEATGSGTLQVDVTLNNAGGTITGGSGAVVQFQGGADIQGGTLTTASGAGLFGSAGSTVTLDGITHGPLTNAASYTISNNLDTQLVGTINNTGSITVSAAANGTDLSMVNAVTLTGGGTVTLTNGNAAIREDVASSSLTNVNNKIVGAGQIGNNGLTFVNQVAGIVNANNAGNALLVNANAVINQNVFEATNGGILQVNVPVNNANANITASGSGSQVQFQSGARIEGGTLNEINSALFFGSTQSIVILDGTTQGPLTNAAAYMINNDLDTQLTGTINNTGSITVNAAANGTALSMVGAVTLTGGGTVTITNGNALIRQDGVGSLTNVNNTIEGAGQLGNNNLTFINQPAGVVNATGNALLVNAIGVVNQGLFEATNGGILQVNVPVNNANANITASGSGSQVQFESGARIEGGTLNEINSALFFGSTQTQVVLDGTTQGPLTNAAAYMINNNLDAELMGTINNTGSITVNAVANGTALSMVGAVTLTGGGTVTITNGNALIRQDAPSSSLTNVNNKIVGAGQLGNNGLTFINQAAGLVNANSPGNALLLNATGVINQNLFEATGGGILQVNVTVNNVNSVIAANSAGSQVQFLTGAHIEGGTLSAVSGAGFFGSTQSQVVLDGSTEGPLTNATAYMINNNLDAELMGTINNTGSITVNAAANGTALSMVGPVILTGGGTVTITNGNALIRQDTGGSSLTNVNNKIVGAGQVGNNGLVFINQPAGLLNANTSGAMLINAAGAVNQGSIEATGGGTLQVGATLNNQGGSINAASGSSVQFQSAADIQGGTLTSDPQATFFGSTQTQVVLDGITHGVLTNAANYTIGNNLDMELMGTINNIGSITVSAAANGTDLSVVNAVTLTGGGAITMSNGNAGIRQDVGGSSLTNSGNTIQGPGLFSVPTFTQTAGLIQIASGVSDSVTTFAINGGNARVDGSLTASGGVSSSGTGVISGIGTISSNVANAGVTEAGDIPATGPLTISNSNTYTQGAAGAYEVAIDRLPAGPVQCSELNVSGSASLAGALNIRFVNGFVPSSGDQCTIIMAASRTGQFATINSPTLPANLAWNVTYNATSVVLSVGTGSSNSFTLTMSEPGTGTGSVTDNLGEINCTDTGGVVTSTCSGSYQSGAVVTLTATPSAGNTFNSWSTCSGTAPCVVTMTGNQTEQAVFAPIVPTFSVSVSEMGTGTGSVTDNTGAINCSEANGIVSGTCSATYASGTPVMLTELATSPTTFGGWGGACSTDGIATTCGLTVSSALSVSANFVPPPTSINLTFAPGATVTQQAAFDCPSNPNPTPAAPCTDPDAHSLQLAIPAVNTAFTVTVTATEIPPTQADGLCEVGHTVLNDFDCRFVTFFSNGTDANGNTIVPLCYTYANGNCVHYAVFSGTPGTEPNPNFYTGPVNWKITWNNDTFAPPAPYTGSTPRLYDDPDYAATPTSAVGTVCTQPMTINGVAQNYSCQFEFDITTFFNPTEPVDAGIGGTTKQLNDVVVAFPPNTAGQLSVTSTPDAATTNAGNPIGFTIAGNNAGPGAESNVTLNDPLPAGTGVNWSINPAYTGPGTCSIAGAIGSQVLSCSFGTAEPGTSTSLHVSSASASVGTYTNAVTVTATNQQLLAIGTITVQPATPEFSGLTASQEIAFGTASVTLSGTISAAGSVFPASGETVSVTINDTKLSATIGSNGAFTLTFPTASIPVSANPYTIIYHYAGDASLDAATDTSTTLTVINSSANVFTLAVSEMGTGTGSVTDNTGAINCSEANGIVSGTCSATYASGTPVMLTELATSPTTFGGWGGACSTDGIATTCGLTVSSALSVSANFVPPPTSINLTFAPGTTVMQQGVFDCPSNPNPTPAAPCTDPDAHSLQLAIPAVNTAFTVTVTATEIPPTQADGLCEVGHTVLNDFDCRFVTFFSNGTDANGNTIVPLCYTYANGNCVHYAVFSGTPGTEPNPNFYTGPVNWKITWNNDTFVPPAPYTGSTPRLYDDPDYAATPTSAVGSVCTQPMTINGVAQNYSCQFEFDITTFFDPVAPVDQGIGGTTKQLNDVVVAFPPNTAGQLSASDTPDASVANAGNPIGFTIAVSNAGPGTETNVALNDPLPAGTGVNWSINPAYSGPGTCSIAGTTGSQVLSCSFGSLASGGSATLHVSSASASLGTYTNAATVTATNEQLLAIGTITVQAATPAFTALTPSQAITFGTASVTLSGTISATGPVFPASGETVSVTINGTTLPATIGSNGLFTLSFPTASIPASATPYTITYSYAGDSNLTSASNTSTTLTVNSVVGTFTLTVSEMGTGIGKVTDNTGAIICSEANGVVSGTCSASYASGTPVMLTELATSPTTFGGWGGACSTDGIATTCGLTVSSALSVSANFVPPPAAVNFTFNPGTTVTQQGVFDCLSNPNPTPSNPCTDPNAHTLQLQLPQVNTPFTLTVTATEIPPNQADGLCEVGHTVLNDFDCRFVTFFSNGTDANGNTIVPLCYTYANGNCVHYAVFSGTPGTEPNPSFYTGPVSWQITWNNDSFVPPAPYTGSTPRLYDDPDYAATPTSAVGTVCTQPMTINGVAQTYSCQFEFDITTFFNPTAPVDAGIGGTTKQLNDVVVAFPPTVGSGQLASTSTSSATTPGNPISFTIAVSNNGPGTETGVTLNDPLPDVSSANWTISPAYSGPGTCSITGAAGSQVLSCAFGNLAAGTNFSIGVTNSTANAGSYTNAATIMASNQQVLSISSATIQGFVTSFSGLSASQTIAFGAASINLSGIISAPGPLYPPTTESVSATINGATQSAAIGSNGTFTIVFPTSTVPASATPYTITYGYAGDTNFSAATNAATLLTVNKANQTINFTGAPATAIYNSTFSVSATATSGLPVTITASGACMISGNTVTMTSGTGTCSLAANQAGNTNYNAAPQATSSTTAQKAASTTTITSNTPNPSNSGQAVAIAVKVTGAVAGTATGSVQVTSSTGESCMATLSSGAGTCSITFTTTGPRTLTAVYSGDNNFIGSTSTSVSQTVNAATASTLKISPSSVNFGNVYVGTLGAQIVTLTNTGTTPITLAKVTIASAGSGNSREFFDLSLLCPATLGAGRSCFVIVTFIPSIGQTTPQTAMLVITDSAAGSPQSVTMTGTPINPQATFSTNLLNFGTQKVNTTSAAMTVTLKNTGTTLLNLTSVALNGNFAPATGTTCVNGGTVNPSATCVLKVTFTPKSKGLNRGSIIVNDNALFNPQIIALTGTGQ